MVNLELSVITYDGCISIIAGDYETIVAPNSPTDVLAQIENDRFPVILGTVDGVNLSISKTNGVYRICSHDSEIDISCTNNIQFMNQLKGALIQLE
jgi:hypothetical protein